MILFYLMHLAVWQKCEHEKQGPVKSPLPFDVFRFQARLNNDVTLRTVGNFIHALTCVALIAGAKHVKSSARRQGMFSF
jgi:hypothetical protein